MPEPSKKKSPVSNKPSLLRRIFGEPVSEDTAKDWPELQRSWVGRQIERPDLERNVTSIKPFGIMDYWKNPNAYASTGPLGGIRLNRERIETEGQDLNDVLVHEMTHAKQGPMGFLKRMFNPGAVENEAINNEALRKVKRKDVELRTPKSVVK